MAVDNSPEHLAKILAENPETASRTFRYETQADGAVKKVKTEDSIFEKSKGAPVDEDPLDPRGDR